MPSTTQEYWELHSRNRGRVNFGRYDWTLQTYLNLIKFGYNCRLIDNMPNEGIVISHHDFLTEVEDISQDVTLIEIQAEGVPLSYANIQIIQNKSQHDGIEKFYIHHWHQNGLINRNPNREEIINVAYYGTPGNLTPELREHSFVDELRKIGLNWKMMT